MNGLKENTSFFLLINLAILILIVIIMPLPAKALGGVDSSPHNLPTRLTGPVVAIRLASTINPGSLEYLKRGLEVAREKGASLFLILLDTPGGLVTPLRKMVQLVMASPVPVAVFVYPPGAQAASAGALLTMAAHIAAMAPGTNIGAAHPVTIGSGNDANSTMSKKMENDLAALAESIAIKRGRNVKWAEEAVRKSISTPASRALKLHVIDLLAQDIPQLMDKIRGRVVTLESGSKVIIAPKDPSPIILEPNIREQVLETIANPNIAYILMMIGMVGLYFELAHPGTILPGTAGVICLLLSLFALHTLSANTTALLLVLLAFILFVLELFVTSHGILAISGAIALALGSIMLFDKSSGVSISASVLLPTLGSVILFFSAIAIVATKAALSRPKTGSEALINQEGTVVRELSPGTFQVFVHGELWHARGPQGLKPGDKVIITEVQGLKLKIKPQEE